MVPNSARVQTGNLSLTLGPSLAVKHSDFKLISLFPQNASKEGQDLEKQKKGKVIKFGWFEGVYVSAIVGGQ